MKKSSQESENCRRQFFSNLELLASKAKKEEEEVGERGAVGGFSIIFSSSFFAFLPSSILKIIEVFLEF